MKQTRIMKRQISRLGYMLWTGISILVITFRFFPAVSSESASLFTKLAILFIPILYFSSVALLARGVMSEHRVQYCELRNRLLLHPAAITIILPIALIVYSW